MIRRILALATLIALSLRALLIMAFGAILYAVLRLVGRVPGQHKREPTAHQSEESQRGEVAYRRRAAFGQPQAVFDLVQARMTRSSIFRSLAQRGVSLSPFIELGAERGQTSLLLTNEFGARGVASDLSVDSLQVIPILRTHFSYRAEPLAVCCDMMHLPLRTGALPFAFCFATLHHFNDLRPVLAEVRRGIGKGGHFYFAEEPLKRALCLNLYRCPRADKMDSLHQFLTRHEFVQYIAEAYIGSREETEYGIVENQSISLRQWEEALAVFDNFELVCDRLPRLDARAYEAALVRVGMAEPRAHRLAAQLFGTTLSALCHVESGPEPAQPGEFFDAFICPNCGRSLRFADVFTCPQCGAFGKQGNVHMLLPRDMAERLYGQAAVATAPRM